jgi:hypothetical protein
MLEMEYDDPDVIQRFTPGEMDEMLSHIQAKPGARRNSSLLSTICRSTLLLLKYRSRLRQAL